MTIFTPCKTGNVPERGQYRPNVFSIGMISTLSSHRNTACLQDRTFADFVKICRGSTLNWNNAIIDYDVVTLSPYYRVEITQFHNYAFPEIVIPCSGLRFSAPLYRNHNVMRFLILTWTFAHIKPQLCVWTGPTMTSCPQNQGPVGPGPYVRHSCQYPLPRTGHMWCWAQCRDKPVGTQACTSVYDGILPSR